CRYDAWQPRVFTSSTAHHSAGQVRRGCDQGRGHHSAVDERAATLSTLLRHPYTSTGPTREVKAAFENFLREHGYKVAPFTIENSDYIFNQIYSDARRNNDSALMERLRKTYLEYNDTQFEFIER